MEVNGQTRDTIPTDKETIADDINIEKLLPILMGFEVYVRPKEACPWARGNWILDFIFNDGQIYCIRLPIEMSDEHVYAFIKPLTDLLNEKNKLTN